MEEVIVSYELEQYTETESFVIGFSEQRSWKISSLWYRYHIICV